MFNNCTLNFTFLQKNDMNFIQIIVTYTMDIVKAFTTNQFNTEISIKGTFDEPLFRANDIATILEIVNVRKSIIDYDDTEKILIPCSTSGGEQNIYYLTEKGLYKLLFKSRKPIAFQFQNWMCDVIKEIRLNGRYDLEEQVKAEKEKADKVKEELELLKQTGDGRPVIYIYNTDVRATKPLLKIGITEKFRERTKPYKQTHPYGKLIFSVPIEDTNLKTAEHWLHTLLTQHRVGGSETFEISEEEAKLWCIHIYYSLRFAHNLKGLTKIDKIARLVEYETKLFDNSEIKTVTKDIEIQTDDTLILEQPVDDNTQIFDKFIEECCIVRPELEVSSVDIQGKFRLWRREASKETFHKLNEYMKTKFQPGRISGNDKDRVVMGFIGLSLKETEIKIQLSIDLNDNEIEQFIIQNCLLIPSGKILTDVLTKEFIEWKKRINKPFEDESIEKRKLKTFFINKEYVLPQVVWTIHGNGNGYYGIQLKSHQRKIKIPSSTAKFVEKRDAKTRSIIDTWSTIAKAAEAENLSAPKLSRMIKNEIITEKGFIFTTPKK